MKSLEEFKTFYETELSKKLHGLELQRKLVFLKVVFALVIVIAMIGGICYYLDVNYKAYSYYAALIPVIVGPAIVGVVYRYLIRGYRDNFKRYVITPVVEFVHPELRYSKDRHVTLETYRQSEMFVQPDRFRGDDLVTGTIGSTRIEFSEVHAEEQHLSSDSEGRNKVTWRTLFKGFFFLAEFERSFKGATTIKIDKAEKFFGAFGKKVQEAFKGDFLVTLDDAEFEKEFIVQSDEPDEAKAILSDQMKRILLDYKQHRRGTLKLYFNETELYITIASKKDFFEPRVFRTVINDEPILNYFQDLQFLISVVEELNRNTEICQESQSA